MGLKQQTLLALFQFCKECGDYEFDNQTVKEICDQIGFGNHFDATKLDNTKLLPDEIKKEGYCVVHLGQGRHRFMKIVDAWYHQFEHIEPEDKKNWPYQPSLLNNTDSSESNIISLVYNQKIIQDFLYEGELEDPNIYLSRRTKITESYRAGTEKIHVNKVQVEVDATFECAGIITVLEGKNGFPDDFCVYQLFYPFLDYHQKVRDAGRIECCYLLQKNYAKRHLVRLYLYSFSDTNDIGSIYLLKKAQYDLRAGE